jgi:hypothetical protein
MCYIWSIAVYDAETWILRKYLERFEMWSGGRMEKIRRTNRVRYSGITYSQGEEEYPTYNEKKGD